MNVLASSFARRGRRLFSPVVSNVLAWATVLIVAILAEPKGAAAPSLVRVPNTTLKLPPNPPVFGYTTTNTFPALTFGSPVAIVTPPGETNRLFVVNKAGFIYVVTNLAQPTKTTFLDLTSKLFVSGESGLLGLAFHPGYATNGYFYVFYSLVTTTSQAANHLHQRVSRFKVSADPNRAQFDSELVYLTQSDPADNHNGGDLHFGRDGYLYISLGDGGVQYDGSGNSQHIDLNYFSSILRIDVDKRPGNLLPNPHPANTTNYFVPADNPFIGFTSFNGTAVNPANVRTEIFALGFRNPWRFSFDPFTGWLYCGDVGQDAYEEVDIVPKGANCGWAYREGLHAGPKAGTPVGLSFTNPIVEYAHGNGATQGNAVVGGVVYHGNRVSQLNGAYVYGDNVSGNIWAIRYDGKTTTTPRQLTARAGISAFGTDPSNGDILIAQVYDGRIYRLAYNGVSTGTPLPPTLADTGAMTDPASLTPAAGIVPYEINTPFWSDNARKRRWFSLPDTNLTVVFAGDTNWSFPAGTVWMKHFELELTNGVPGSAKRLETRFIVRNSSGVYGVTYRWGNSSTNATLVAEEGLDEAFAINDGGIIRTQIWHYPVRTECVICYTPVGGFGLGFNTVQLNRDMDYGAGQESQIAALAHAGYFYNAPSNTVALPALAAAADTSSSVEWRVRSYLSANCSQCHQPGGTGGGTWDARWQTPLINAGIVDGLLRNNFGDTNNRVIAPGDLAHSILFSRISVRGARQMPPLASSEIDQNDRALLAEWVTNALPAEESFAAWQTRYFASTNTPNALADADPDGDGAPNYVEYLTHTDPTKGTDVWVPALEVNGSVVTVDFLRVASRGFQIESTSDLSNPGSWTLIDSADNRLWFPATDQPGSLSFAAGASGAQFYRFRIVEP
ncbi:MAG TPA: PQQ-dependent sugar dehydrogenase [Candidatus Limnocylindria bacterium]|nr:PQQ-dependent sugar dehydrogenase [Candidatus Limnocylindria bacterium]